MDETALVVIDGDGVIDTPLTPEEAEELVQCEAVIRRGFQTYIEVGNALKRIKVNRLYRAYGTFEDYCKLQLDCAWQRAYQLIDAAKVAENLKNFREKPANDSQARQLARLEPQEQVEAWQRTIDRATAEGAEITAKLIKRVVDERMFGESDPDDEEPLDPEFDPRKSKTLGLPVEEDAIYSIVNYTLCNKRVKALECERISKSAAVTLALQRVHETARRIQRFESIDWPNEEERARLSASRETLEQLRDELTKAKDALGITQAQLEEAQEEFILAQQGLLYSGELYLKAHPEAEKLVSGDDE